MATLDSLHHVMQRRWDRIAPPLQAAIVGGGIVGALFLFVPIGLLERFVMASGIPAVLGAAQPPLGLTARLALSLSLGGAIGGFIWVGLVMLEDEDTDALLRAVQDRLGGRRADRTPRPPVFAERDLGTPFLEVKAATLPAAATIAAPAPELLLHDALPTADSVPERTLPLDLDQPLMNYAAVAEVPVAAEPAAAALVPPLVVPEWVERRRRPQLIDPGDRFETFELTPVRPVARPVVRPAARPVPAPAPAAAPSLRAAPRIAPPAAPAADVLVAPDTASSVTSLLDRLERGLGRMPAPAATAPAAVTVEDTLGDLRRLATGTR